MSGGPEGLDLLSLLEPWAMRSGTSAHRQQWEKDLLQNSLRTDPGEALSENQVFNTCEDGAVSSVLRRWDLQCLIAVADPPLGGGSDF